MPQQLDLGLGGEAAGRKPRNSFRQLIDHHLAAIAADRAIRESAWETAQQLRELRKACTCRRCQAKRGRA